MSRHRFVRNLDLDAEMASDSEEEEEEGMSPEEKAMPIARAQLNDLKPPISDDAIADSLWHYWFDVDKAVGWLRKDWEKKSEPIPASLRPTPDEQRRRRSAKSPRTQRDDSPQPPISALQRLSLARKEAAAKTASAAGATAPADSVSSSGPSEGKPMSKLAILAQKRREEASARLASASGSPAPSGSSTPATAAAPEANSPARPLSKLAQKMAAARASRAETPSQSTTKPPTPGEGPAEAATDQDMEENGPDLFRPTVATSCRPSTFFNLLTTHQSVPNMFASSSTQLHLPFVKDEAKLERRVRAAFGPDVESPDDIILKARGGRAGTGEAGANGDAVSRPAPIKVAIPKVVLSDEDMAVGEGTEKPGSAVSKKGKGKSTGTRAKTAIIKQSVQSTSEHGDTVVPTKGPTPNTKAKPRPQNQVGPQNSAKPNQSQALSSDEKAPTSAKRKPRPPEKLGQGDPPTVPKAKPKPKIVQGPPADVKAPTPKSVSMPGKPRTPAVASTSRAASTSRTQPNTPKKASKAQSVASSSGANTPSMAAIQNGTGLQQDLAGLHLTEEVDLAEQEREREKYKEKPGLNMKQEELVAKVKKEEEESGKQGVSLIVVGHVDAGKSTLMGRLLYDIGELSEKEKTANERGSKRVGKSSFAFAWGLDALGDERDRGVTIDIATTHFATPHRSFTLLDAPGHRDFIPAMISGAAQADVALLVVDGSPGEFEAGFDRGGQTREHAWLVRSLGVKEIIVGINKMDLVEWSQDRYDDIVDALTPFLASAGFATSRTTFLPIAAMDGINVLVNSDAKLKEWYHGPTLIDTLDKVEVPSRPYESPLRIPVSNVFKGQTAVASGVAVSGRLCSGVIQVGDRVRAVPGDEVANVRTIEVDEDSAQYAVAGQNVTLYLSGIDPIHLGIGTVLCPTNYPVPMISSFTAQILVFDVSSPIITGTAVELFHHSINLPATISKLVSISEKGAVVKQRPRVLQKGVTATVEITLRATQNSGRAPTMPLEISSENKEMGRVLIRRAGETIAAGVVLALGS